MKVFFEYHCAQHCNGLFTLHHSLFTHLDANIMFAPLPQSLPSRGREELRNSYGLYKSRLVKDILKFFGYLIQATFQSAEKILMQTSCLCPSPDFARKQVFGKNLPLPQGAGNTDYTVMLNLFQHLSFLQLIPHPFPLSYLGEGNTVYINAGISKFFKIS